ncbi:hypothetical protein QWJ34_23370 [Saccharibacillus sp. CPCC 101409]|uniref:hypothetical protein n=1 Tax=Saccharibacillus sp. CPCC 101409 TaxID=3058041 RepID=UPI002673AD65|nr:hypothetical protein [Saccharibacillus sp. CPCC 101409]MDO3412727.1 hypothetical protein [Saccharibacillus sp. CPCC 101409]
MFGRKWRKRIKRKTILLGLAGMIMLTGCSTVRETMAQLEMYGSNEKIAQSGDSYSYKLREGQADESGASLEFKQFTGVHTLWSADAEREATVTLDLDVGVKNGKFKVVHVRPDGEVIKLADASLGGEPVTIELPEGRSEIKIVGKKAYGHLEARFSDNETAHFQPVKIQ